MMMALQSLSPVAEAPLLLVWNSLPSVVTSTSARKNANYGAVKMKTHLQLK